MNSKIITNYGSPHTFEKVNFANPEFMRLMRWSWDAVFSRIESGFLTCLLVRGTSKPLERWYADACLTRFEKSNRRSPRKGSRFEVCVPVPSGDISYREISESSEDLCQKIRKMPKWHCCWWIRLVKMLDRQLESEKSIFGHKSFVRFSRLERR